jgi:predicted ABC-type ATPase
MSAPVCWIIAGPNGAGKITFALEYLPSLAGFHQFINADLIAAGLSPLSPERERVAAARLFLREIGRSVANQESFAFETTLSGRGYLTMLQDMKRKGWRIELIYLALPSVPFAQDRVRERVAHGGHDIADDDIERRYF